MPIGVIFNSLCIIIGGIIGVILGPKLKDDFKDNLTMIFGCCAMAMGISSIVLIENLPAVILSIIIGTIIGMTIRLGHWINKGGAAMQGFISRFIKTNNTAMSETEFTNTLITIIVLACASGTGIYGSIVAGMSGEHSILITKSILDFFTFIIFATTLGPVTITIAIPQFIIFILL